MRFNKIKQSLLATAIALSLSTGTSYADAVTVYPNALPTGGTVVDGTITGLTGGNAIAGTPIELTTASGIIDWNAFNVGKDATLNFVLNNGALLNRVTGGDMSFLLGKINADNGTLLISNPNGILVGGGAVINANDLVLTTMNIGTEDFTKLVNGENITLTGGNVPFYVEEGAQLNIKELLQMSGGSVNVADNVTISTKKVDLAAAGELTANKDGGFSNVATNGGVLTVGDVTIGTAENKVERAELYGNTINLNSTKINSSNDIKVQGHKVNIDKATLSADADVNIFAVREFADSDPNKLRFSFDDLAKVNGATITSGKNIAIRGGSAEITNSTIKAKDGDIVVSASLDADVNDAITPNGIKGRYVIVGQNTMSVDGSTVEAEGEHNIRMIAGNLTIGGKEDIADKTTIKAKNAIIGSFRGINDNGDSPVITLEGADLTINEDKVTITADDKQLISVTRTPDYTHWGGWDVGPDGEAAVTPAPKPEYVSDPPIDPKEDPKDVLEKAPSADNFKKYLEENSAETGSKMETAEGIFEAIKTNENLNEEQKAAYVATTVKFVADQPKDNAGVGKLLSVIGSAPLSAEQKAECIEAIKTNDVVKDVTLTGKDKLVEGSGDVSTAAVTAAAPAAPAVSSEAEGDPVSVN